MLEFLKILDFFPVPLSLKYKSHNYFRTWTGLFFTIVLLVLIFVYLLSLFSDLINKENPNIGQASFKLDDPTFFPIDYENFPIMIGLSDFYTATNYINESIYHVRAELMVLKKLDDSNEKVLYSYPIPMQPCTYEYLNATNISQLLLKQNWDGFHCIQNNLLEFSNFSIGGAFEQDVFQFLRIYFTTCKGVGCGSDEEIQMKLNRGYASIYFMDYVDDFKSNEIPMKPYGRNIFTNFGINYTKGIDINFKEVIVSTDTGLFSSEEHIDRYRLYEDIKEFFEPIQALERFFYFELKISKSKTEFKRQYPKIQDILSKAGGLINILFLLFSLIILPFAKITFYWDLLNECFNMHNAFEDKDKFSNIKAFNKRDSINSEDRNVRDHNKMHFRIKDYFLFYFYKLFPNYLKQLRIKKTYIGIFSIEKMLDIRNIIKKLHEIDKLKLLLLSDQQLVIFNHLPKPPIQGEVNNQIGRISLYGNNKRDYITRYDELKKKEDKTDIDLKLLNMIEKKAERRKINITNIRSIKIQKVKFQSKKKMKLYY